MSACGSLVWVRAGTYAPRLSCKSNLVLLTEFLKFSSPIAKPPRMMRMWALLLALPLAQLSAAPPKVQLTEIFAAGELNTHGLPVVGYRIVSCPR